MEQTNVIIGQRGSGKTYRLFEEADQVGGIIVGANPIDLRTAARMKGFLNIKNFIGYSDFIEDYCQNVEYKYFIDNIEIFVSHIFPQVQNYTVSI